MRVSAWAAKLGMAAVVVAALAGSQALPASASLTAAVSADAAAGSAAARAASAPAVPTARAQAIVTAAERWVTSPVTAYCWGGGDDSGPTHGDGEAAGHYSGPKGKSGCYAASVTGFDCSGLVKYAIYQALGISLYHSAQDQSEGITDAGPNVHPKIIKMADLEPGDVVAFGGSKSDIGHDGIYVGNGEIVNAYDYKNDGDNGTNNEYWGVMKMALSWVRGGFTFAEGVRFWSTGSAPAPTPSPTPTPTRTPAPAPTVSATATPTPDPTNTAPAGADDWAQAGHDAAEDFDNQAETTIGTSDVQNLARAWSVTPSLVLPQPVVYQGEVYRLTGSMTGIDKGTDVLSASELATGRVQWSRSLGGDGLDALYGASDGEVFYGTSGSDGELVAASASTGAVVWRSADAAFADGAGEVLLEGPDVIDGVLNVQVLSASTGKQIWQASDGAGAGGPAAFAVSGGRVVREASISGKVYLESRKLTTGKVQWTTRVPCTSAANNTNLAIGGSLIYFHDSCSGTLRAYRLSTGKLDWKITDTGARADVGMATNGSTVYAVADASGQPAVWAYAAGKARWQAQLGAGTYPGTTPTLAGGVLYVTVDNPVHGTKATETTLAFNAATGKKLWTSPGLPETLDTPFVADGHLLVGSQVFGLG